MTLNIDINCDMGESYGNFKVGQDEAIFPWITSSNIACGFHGGDPLHIESTIRQAIAHGVQVGAHPGFPDLQGFGRRKMQIKPNELKAIVKYQIAALKGLTESLGSKLIYVKPHGALYNQAADNEAEAKAIVEAVKEIDEELILMGLAGSLMENMALSQKRPFVAEAFADRRYTDIGRLRSRALENAVIHDPQEAAQQVISIVKNQCVYSYSGQEIPLKAQTICIHGDNHIALDILKAIDTALTENGIQKKGFA